MRRPVIRKRHEERVERARLSLARSMSTAAADVLAERQRQQGVEGWAHRHDDAHSDGSLAAAAAVYAMTGSQPELRMSIATYNATLKALWPSSWRRLRELGFDPEQLLAEFDKAVHIATQ